MAKGIDDDHIPLVLRHVSFMKHPDPNNRTVIQNTLKYFEKIWEENIRANEPFFSKFPAIDVLLKNTSNEKKTVVLAAAGPSLDLALPHLKKHRGKLKIMAVDASLYPLLTEGIKPNWVFNVDAENLAAEFFKGFPTHELTLITPVVTHPDVLKVWKGKVIFYMPWASNKPMYDMAVKYHTIPMLPVNYNVGSTALVLLNAMKFRHIVLTGIDFVFTNDRYYCKNALLKEMAGLDTREKLFTYFKDDVTFITMPDGRQVLTRSLFTIFGESLETFLLAEGIKNLINTSCPMLKNYPMQDIGSTLESL